MAANNYLEQRSGPRPLSFGGVLLLHGAVIAGVLMIKGPVFERSPSEPTTVYQVPLDTPPPPAPPPPEPQRNQQVVTPPLSRLDVPPRVIPTPVPTPPTFAAGRPTVPPGPVIGPSPTPSVQPPAERLVTVPPRDPPREPVRVAAQWDPRFAGAMQPPYPASEQRNEREGIVRVRVTIGPDGRVTAVQRISATSEAFWRATERQALSRWRFKPAMVDGKPVAASKELSVVFKLDGQ